MENKSPEQLKQILSVLKEADPKLGTTGTKAIMLKRLSKIRKEEVDKALASIEKDEKNRVQQAVNYQEDINHGMTKTYRNFLSEFSRKNND